MHESVNMRRRVEEDGLWVVNSCQQGVRMVYLIRMPLIVPAEEVTANSVPAAAVIQRWRTLFGFTGRKGSAGGPVCQM